MKPGLDDRARSVRFRLGGFGPAGRWPDWLVLFPLTVLVFAVAALATYTTVVNLRVMAINRETVAVRVPALRAAQDLMIQAAIELEALYRYTLKGDAPALADYRESAAARRVATAELVPLVDEVHDGSRRQAEALLRLAQRWDQIAPDPELLARLGHEASEQYLARAQLLYREILLQATATQDALREDIDAPRSWAIRAERLVWYFTLGLAALAFAASLLVHRLVRQVRGLADESRQRRVEAEAAMENRSRLIRGITHDVKNPLSTADGSAQLFEMGILGSLTSSQHENVGRIRRSIGAALGIISDLLELSRAEAGGLKVEVSPIDIAPILGAAVEDEQSTARKAGLTMRLDLSAELPRVRSDTARVRQIVGNLLSNAVKYTPSGGQITISTAMRSSEETGLLLAVSVADTGPGIAPHEHERIFEEFYRSRPLEGRSTGLGLGLSISRRIARLLGGDLTVESEPGKGSVFTLWLPVVEVAGDRAA